MVPRVLRLILLGLIPLTVPVIFSSPLRCPAKKISAAKTTLLAEPFWPTEKGTTPGRDSCTCLEDDDSDGPSSESRRLASPGGKLADTGTRPVLPTMRRRPARGPSGSDGHSLIYQLRKLLI